ncbi:hypothetical protein F4861DRAFT_549970 [Xylaria intraflava]|nr:hypothetical protein F4861DRAFT_549970 [Xylaria intraflava]
MSENTPAGEGGRNDERHHGPPPRRERIDRTLGMPDEEVASRQRRRARYLAQIEEEKKRKQEEANENTVESSEDGTDVATDVGKSTAPQQEQDDEPFNRRRKPWETLVVGRLGENLSRIEWKDREIEQRRFIVKHHEKHSPHQVAHNKRILDRLIRERSEMEDNEENNMPQDQREKQERITRRLDTLRSTIEHSVCEDEKINIRAAIQGYESGQIQYSHEFTLIYAGHIVDQCRTYHDSSQNRRERLERYFAEHGPGWLWHEPPLAGSGIDALAMKGLCLERNHLDTYGIGNYKADLKFTIEQDKVSKGKTREHTIKKGKRKIKVQNGDASCQLETLLDSGATFPIILESDLEQLDVDLTEYPAQGVMHLNVVGGTANLKFYEMYVSVCSEEGASLVGKGDKAVWPAEPRNLGGFCPVLAQRDGAGGANKYLQRLSGMIPFDACYMSSAPSMGKLWLGEDRRDVLGTSRLPAHLRYDTDKSFLLEYPEEFESLRKTAQTPERVIFVHGFASRPDIMLTDVDVAEARGRSEIAIGQYLPPGSRTTVVPKRVLRVEPRKGDVKIVPKKDARPWQNRERGARVQQYNRKKEAEQFVKA